MYKHTNELITPMERKNWIVNYIENSIDMVFSTEMGKRFNENKPQFQVRINKEYSNDKIKEVLSTFLTDMNTWAKSQVDEKIIDEEARETSKGNIFIVMGFNHSETNFNVVDIEVMS